VNASCRPLGNTWVTGRATLRLRSSRDHTSGRSSVRAKSLTVTSEPLSALRIRAPALRMPDSWDGMTQDSHSAAQAQP
jgi:hypothetical protein